MQHSFKKVRKLIRIHFSKVSINFASNLFRACSSIFQSVAKMKEFLSFLDPKLWKENVLWNEKCYKAFEDFCLWRKSCDLVRRSSWVFYRQNHHWELFQQWIGLRKILDSVESYRTIYARIVLSELAYTVCRHYTVYSICTRMLHVNAHKEFWNSYQIIGIRKIVFRRNPITFHNGHELCYVGLHLTHTSVSDKYEALRNSQNFG